MEFTPLAKSIVITCPASGNKYAFNENEYTDVHFPADIEYLKTNKRLRAVGQEDLIIKPKPATYVRMPDPMPEVVIPVKKPEAKVEEGKKAGRPKLNK